MKKFFVIHERNINDFNKIVNWYLSEGWVVQGGVCYADGTYSVAMVF